MDRVRSGVFETNSSGTHEFCLPKEYKVIDVDKNALRSGTIEIDLSGGIDAKNYRYYTLQGKLMFIAAMTHCGGANLERDGTIKTIRKLVKEKTGCDVKFKNVEQCDLFNFRDLAVFPSLDHELEQLLFNEDAYISTKGYTSYPMYIDSDVGQVNVLREHFVQKPIEGDSTFALSFSVGFLNRNSGDLIITDEFGNEHVTRITSENFTQVLACLDNMTIVSASQKDGIKNSYIQPLEDVVEMVSNDRYKKININLLEGFDEHDVEYSQLENDTFKKNGIVKIIGVSTAEKIQEAVNTSYYFLTKALR